MSRAFRTCALLVSGFVLLSGSVIVVNQTVQVVQLARSINPTLGTVTLWGLLAAYAGMLGVPVVMFVRLPSPLIPPESEEGPEFEQHLEKLRQRLTQSPHLVGHDFSDRVGIESALKVLDTRANEIVRDTAASVFVATAVSQSGRLDAFLVLSAQSRMIWKLAHLYQQRPTVKDFVHLYSNVAATAFLAGELDEIDLHQQVEPVLSSAIGALGASVPGFQVAGALLVNCVLSGSANAFLTLRVGMISKRQCGALVTQERATIRRAATAEAAQLLGGIVAEGTGNLTKALWKAGVDKIGGAFSGTANWAKDAGAKLFAKIRTGQATQATEAV